MKPANAAPIFKPADAAKYPRYEGDRLHHLVFPLGGMGAGMIGLEGAGAFSQVSLRHLPDVMHEPLMFAALKVDGVTPARVLEGPVPPHKIVHHPKANGGRGDKNFGLPRFAKAAFTSRFPFGRVELSDPAMPVRVELTGWSPFAPPDPDSASLPVAGLEYRFVNKTARRLKAVFSFHARNFMKPQPQTPGTVTPLDSGFALEVPETIPIRYVGGWSLSRLFPKDVPVTEAPPVKLTDPLDWRPADLFNYFAQANKRYSGKDGLVYFATRLTAPEAGRWLFRVGHDGGMRLFVDGVPVGAEGKIENPHRPDRTDVEVALSKGPHEVLVAFDLAGGRGWGVSLSFKPVPGAAGPAALPEPETWIPLPPAVGGGFSACTDSPGAAVDTAWFRGAWFDTLTRLWDGVERGERRTAAGAHGKSDGGSFSVPIVIPARGEQTVRVRLAWHVPKSDLSSGGVSACDCGGACGPRTYAPWYASRFKTLADVTAFWRTDYAELRARTAAFTRCFYDTTLPAEAVEAAAANLSILKTPTVLRQHDGRLWGWEGCTDAGGCCSGTCTHVWNYAVALCHLFPKLEQGLRETEFLASQDARGHQTFRAALPIGPTGHEFHAAADGQLGGLIKAYREWRIGGDPAWLKRLWPQLRQSLDYMIGAWDPDRKGTVSEPHHNTYDIEFWGPDGMCTSFYLGALQAAVLMGRACGEPVDDLEALLARGKAFMEKTLWNGEYFIQKVKWKDLHAKDPAKAMTLNPGYSPEALVLLEKEGPKYQYATGCLSDGVLGDWLARQCGLPPVLDPVKVRRHVQSVFRYNFKRTLKDHANPQRPGYALGDEGGLLLCSWPKGGKPSLPFVYSDEVWTGIEYQAAGHMIQLGLVKEGLAVTKMVRTRYDGLRRNPFDEFECGHWYARAMASYGLLSALSGARYDAIEKTLYLDPKVKGDFRAFLSTATGFGTVGIRKGKPFVEVVGGDIPVDTIMKD